MRYKVLSLSRQLLLQVTVISGLFLTTNLVTVIVRAAAPPANNPQSGSVGLSGILPSAPPKAAATIATPTNGQTFTTLPITVSGLCTTGLMVKVFDNNVFVGAVMCANGSYSLEIDLFSGQNQLIARVVDALDQAGPDSNLVTVTFNDTQFNTSGTALLTLTSDYARRGANPGSVLTWPVIVNGGTGPYAISVDWGDSQPQSLISQQFPGVVNLQHVYNAAGLYQVIVKATDKNGLTAYLQLVAVANGAITSNAVSAGNTGSSGGAQVKLLWLPAVMILPLLFVSFWLGRRYALSSLRKHLQRSSY